ncbi:MAG: DUF1549 domain-containing protein, partial [Planctomycetaceae bacterium]|nr:DUF1549 domain-containing protein [Planctomycetaceae bacterium]
MTARNPYHLLFVVLGLIVPRGLHASETTTVDFRRDVRPLLSDKCFRCHGPDEERASDIRLDQEASAKEVRHAGAAVVPFDPQHSLLMQRILTDDPAARMPPPESGLTLTAKETDLLNRWIAEGANWSEHWAFAPLHAESVPRTHSAWATGSIDRFVEARLTASGLTPSDAADRRTLIRRLSFDL